MQNPPDMDPFPFFNAFYAEELGLTRALIPSACCLSTLGLDGFPNARFLSLKEVLSDAFVITGPVSSRKGLEIAQSNRVALSFWWTESGRQVRIQGYATPITEERADVYFAQRALDSQIVSCVSDQGKELTDPDMLQQAYEAAEKQHLSQAPARPATWGGYVIHPVRIEFMTFKTTRFHERQLFTLTENGWSAVMLQP